MRALLLITLSLAFSSFVVSCFSPVPLNSTDSWGIFRPGLYLGLRALHEKSPLFGFLWGPAVNSENPIENIRHWAEERDSIKFYSHEEILGAGEFFKQRLEDDRLNIKMTMKGIRCQEGFALRIDVDNLSGHSSAASNFLFSLSSGAAQQFLKAGNSQIFLESKKDFANLTLSSIVRGEKKIPPLTWNNPAKNFRFEEIPLYQQVFSQGFSALENSWDAGHHVRESLKLSIIKQWQERERKQRIRRRSAETGQPEPALERDAGDLVALLNGGQAKPANLVIMQRVLKPPFTMDFLLHSTERASAAGLSGSDEKSFDALLASQLLEAFPKLKESAKSGGSELLESLLEEKSSEFERRFNSKFDLSGFSAGAVRMAKAALSNLVGGVGFWSGRSRHEIEKQNDKGEKRLVEVQPESSLFSAVPSRSFFPRGFLWDEGFHQLLVSHWDSQLSAAILESWINQIHTGNSSVPHRGWIPREQILGLEARARVPEPFQVQRPSVANPPTLILALGRLITRAQQKRENSQKQTIAVEVNADGSISEDFIPDSEQTDEERSLNAFLLRAFPRLLLHADWYFRTQSSHRQSESALDGSSSSLSSAVAFRWAGRTRTHCLASGLDDYPRAKWIPSENDKRKEGAEEFGLEGHVDLHTWMAALTRTLAIVSEFLARHSDGSRTAEFSALAASYNEKSSQILSRLTASHWNNVTGTFCDYGYKNFSRVFVCHSGYVSLFPFLLGQIDPRTENRQLSAIVEMLADTSRIASPWGILSLSRKDRLFGAQENYWRGNIWGNINYLVLQALKHYSQPELGLLSHTSTLKFQSSDVPADLRAAMARLYSSLRSSYVDNLEENFSRQGFLFEQYDANTGQGKKSHPFTGWTALVVNIMAETY